MTTREQRRFDKTALAEERARELFEKHFRLALRYWTAYQKARKKADRAQAELAKASAPEEFDPAQRAQDVTAAFTPWPTKRKR